VVEYNKDSKPQYDLILGTETMKEFGIILSFRFSVKRPQKEIQLINVL
jgi:hypothetical protein